MVLLVTSAHISMSVMICSDMPDHKNSTYVIADEQLSRKLFTAMSNV